MTVLAPVVVQAADVNLTPEEVARICHPLRQKAAQVRFLRTKLKLIVHTTPDGSPIVSRDHYNTIMAGGAPLAPGAAGKRGPAANAADAEEESIVVTMQAWAARQAEKRKARGKKA